MDGLQCSNVGMAVNIHEETGEVKVLLSLHDLGEEAASAWALLPPQLAADVAQGLMARAMEAQALVNEITAVPPDDRAAKVAEIYTRMHSPFN